MREAILCFSVEPIEVPQTTHCMSGYELCNMQTNPNLHITISCDSAPSGYHVSVSCHYVVSVKQQTFCRAMETLYSKSLNVLETTLYAANNRLN